MAKYRCKVCGEIITDESIDKCPVCKAGKDKWELVVEGTEKVWATEHVIGEELGLAEDTIIVFTTDHGHFVGQHGLIRKGPFHYEDLIKIPFIVKYPGFVPENKVSHSLQSLVDLAPTFLSICGIKIPYDMTGIDQTKAWYDENKKLRDHIICENHHEPTTIHLKTYVDERYKLTVYYNQTYGELFDLKEDPKELNNLWDNKEYKELKSELLLKYIWAELGKEPMWMPRIKQA